MRLFVLVLCLILPNMVFAQSSTVRPDQLHLSVSVANEGQVPYVREMVMITIRGVYKRHITREKLRQPDFDGFNWTQLGRDHWYEERIEGQTVKVLERKMALYPERSGTLTIGAFTHELTLTDEGDDWFDHQITSEPVTVEVAPLPPLAEGEWWFPARGLRISDDWSNAPDQLQPGEGVLRVIRIEAVGVTPEMIPPMPELTSPSAMIFPHPEKRLVELSPEGPVTYAFWRYTIRPTNTTSAILEPIEFTYFDTRARVSRAVTITPQRVAFARGETVVAQALPDPARLPSWPLALVALAVFAAGVGWLSLGRRIGGMAALRRFAVFDPLAWRLRAAERSGDARAMRRAAAAYCRAHGAGPARRAALAALDRAIFDPGAGRADLAALRRVFLAGDPV